MLSPVKLIHNSTIMDIWCFSFYKSCRSVDKFCKGVGACNIKLGKKCYSFYKLPKHYGLTRGTVKSPLLGIRVLLNKISFSLTSKISFSALKISFCICIFYTKLSTNFNYFKSLNLQREEIFQILQGKNKSIEMRRVSFKILKVLDEIR